MTAAAVVVIGVMLAGGVPASAVSGRNIGPVQINPLGHPGLCWQASGGGEPIMLERCNPKAEAQKWTLTGNGVITNGIGDCLEAGVGEPDGTPLYIDFADQCYGQSGQVWRYVSRTGQLSGLGGCAALSGPANTGTEIVRSACPASASPPVRWSIGYGSVTLAADGTTSVRAGAVFSAPVTVANAASAQTAYGVTVSFGLPPRLSVTGLVGVGATAGFLCDVQAMTCTGTLQPGASGRIVVSGRVSAGAHGARVVSARVFVARTSQLPGTVNTSAALTVSVRAAPRATAAPGGGPSGMLLDVLIAIALILLALVLLVGLTRPGWRLLGYRGHRRQPAHRAPPARSTVGSRRLYSDPHSGAPGEPGLVGRRQAGCRLLIAKRADLDLNGERFGQAEHLARVASGVLDVGGPSSGGNRTVSSRSSTV